MRLLLMVMLACTALVGVRPGPERKVVVSQFPPSDLEYVLGAALSPDGQRLATSAVYRAAGPGGDQWRGEAKLWDLRTGSLLADRLLMELSEEQRLQSNWSFQERFVAYSKDGQKIAVFDGASEICVLSAGDLKELHRIDIGAPLGRDVWILVTYDESLDRAGVVVWQGGSEQSVRAFDLVSGKLLHEWTFNTPGDWIKIGMEGTGRRLGVSLGLDVPTEPLRPLAKGSQNLVILDVDSGRVISRWNTGYLAGPVVFGPEGTVLTASLNIDPKYFKGDSIKVWDASTGRLLREIGNRPEGVHNLLSMSGDGKAIVGYTGLDEPIEYTMGNVYLQFAVWDYSSGARIAQSRIQRPEPGNPEEKHWGLFMSQDLRLSTNAIGGRVIAWWFSSSRPFVIFDIR